MSGYKDAKKQAKDIPTLPVLKFLEQLNGEWANWYGNEFEKSVTLAMPDWVTGKLALAKMRGMVSKGLVRGCPCGCRGDFVITEKGLKRIQELERLEIRKLQKETQ